MVYLEEGCLGVRGQNMLSLGACSLGALCLDEGTERKVLGATVMGNVKGKPSGHLSQDKMSTAEGKERAAAAGDAGATAVFPGSLMRLQDFV